MHKRHHMPEPEITVMTNVDVPRGTLIYPFQGTVRMDKLDVFSFLDDTDVSSMELLSSFKCEFARVVSYILFYNLHSFVFVYNTAKYYFYEPLTS